jgi:hypothetical protein
MLVAERIFACYGILPEHSVSRGAPECCPSVPGLALANLHCGACAVHDVTWPIKELGLVDGSNSAIKGGPKGAIGIKHYRTRLFHGTDRISAQFPPGFKHCSAHTSQDGPDHPHHAAPPPGNVRTRTCASCTSLPFPLVHCESHDLGHRRMPFCLAPSPRVSRRPPHRGPVGQASDAVVRSLSHSFSMHSPASTFGHIMLRAIVADGCPCAAKAHVCIPRVAGAKMR